jgi:hypothetical protein
MGVCMRALRVVQGRVRARCRAFGRGLQRILHESMPAQRADEAERSPWRLQRGVHTVESLLASALHSAEHARGGKAHAATGGARAPAERTGTVTAGRRLAASTAAAEGSLGGVATIRGAEPSAAAAAPTLFLTPAGISSPRFAGVYATLMRVAMDPLSSFTEADAQALCDETDDAGAEVWAQAEAVRSAARTYVEGHEAEAEWGAELLLRTHVLARVMALTAARRVGDQAAFLLAADAGSRQALDGWYRDALLAGPAAAVFVPTGGEASRVPQPGAAAYLAEGEERDAEGAGVEDRELPAPEAATRTAAAAAKAAFGEEAPHAVSLAVEAALGASSSLSESDLTDSVLFFASQQLATAVAAVAPSLRDSPFSSLETARCLLQECTAAVKALAAITLVIPRVQAWIAGSLESIVGQCRQHVRTWLMARDAAIFAVTGKITSVARELAAAKAAAGALQSGAGAAPGGPRPASVAALRRAAALSATGTSARAGGPGETVVPVLGLQPSDFAVAVEGVALTQYGPLGAAEAADASAEEQAPSPPRSVLPSPDDVADAASAADVVAAAVSVASAASDAAAGAIVSSQPAVAAVSAGGWSRSRTLTASVAGASGGAAVGAAAPDSRTPAAGASAAVRAAGRAAVADRGCAFESALRTSEPVPAFARITGKGIVQLQRAFAAAERTGRLAVPSGGAAGAGSPWGSASGPLTPGGGFSRRGSTAGLSEEEAGSMHACVGQLREALERAASAAASAAAASTSAAPSAAAALDIAPAWLTAPAVVLRPLVRAYARDAASAAGMCAWSPPAVRRLLVALAFTRLRRAPSLAQLLLSLQHAVERDSDGDGLLTRSEFEGLRLPFEIAHAQAGGVLAAFARAAAETHAGFGPATGAAPASARSASGAAGGGFAAAAAAAHSGPAIGRLLTATVDAATSQDHHLSQTMAAGSPDLRAADCLALRHLLAALFAAPDGSQRVDAVSLLLHLCADARARPAPQLQGAATGSGSARPLHEGSSAGHYHFHSEHTAAAAHKHHSPSAGSTAAATSPPSSRAASARGSRGGPGAEGKEGSTPPRSRRSSAGAGAEGAGSHLHLELPGSRTSRGPGTATERSTASPCAAAGGAAALAAAQPLAHALAATAAGLSVAEASALCAAGLPAPTVTSGPPPSGGSTHHLPAAAGRFAALHAAESAGQRTPVPVLRSAGLFKACVLAQAYALLAQAPTDSAHYSEGSERLLRSAAAVQALHTQAARDSPLGIVVSAPALQLLRRLLAHAAEGGGVRDEASAGCACTLSDLLTPVLRADAPTESTGATQALLAMAYAALLLPGNPCTPVYLAGAHGL